MLKQSRFNRPSRWVGCGEHPFQHTNSCVMFQALGLAHKTIMAFTWKLSCHIKACSAESVAFFGAFTVFLIRCNCYMLSLSSNNKASHQMSCFDIWRCPRSPAAFVWRPICPEKLIICSDNKQLCRQSRWTQTLNHFFKQNQSVWAQCQDTLVHYPKLES